MNKAKALMVPFGYPGYPDELMKKFRTESVNHLKRLGMAVKAMPNVIDFADAKATRDAIAAEDFEFIVVVVLSWLEATNVIEAIRDFAHKPILLWSHTMWQEKKKWLTLGPMPGAAVLRQAFEELRYKFKFVYGQPGDRKLDADIATFCRAAHAYHALRRTRIGLLGYLSMGMYSAAFDHLGLQPAAAGDHENQHFFVAFDNRGGVFLQETEKLGVERRAVLDRLGQTRAVLPVG